MSTYRGMSLRESLKTLESFGGEYRRIRRTGEYLCWHKDCRKRVVLNSRRKDAPVALATLLLAAERVSMKGVDDGK